MFFTDQSISMKDKLYHKTHCNKSLKNRCIHKHCNNMQHLTHHMLVTKKTKHKLCKKDESRHHQLILDSCPEIFTLKKSAVRNSTSYKTLFSRTAAYNSRKSDYLQGPHQFHVFSKTWTFKTEFRHFLQQFLKHVITLDLTDCSLPQHLPFPNFQDNC